MVKLRLDVIAAQKLCKGGGAKPFSAAAVIKAMARSCDFGVEFEH